MILAVYTNSDDVTADYICDKKPDWVKIIRFNTDVLFPIILSNDAKQLLRTIDVLWYRRPFENEILLDEIEDKVRFSENEEAVWNYLLQIPQKKWVNYPVNNWLAEKKLTN